ncbi:MAG: hypothetical protein WDW38_007009 [Sanguina aurantia]
MRGMEAPPTPRITCRDRLKAGRPVLHYPLEAFAWAHILAIQWLPWLAPYAMQETYFLRGLALGVAVEGGNIVISFALYRLGYILTFPKMLDLCLLSALVPLLIATYVGNDEVQFGCWAYMQLAINCAAAGTMWLSVCLPHKRAFSVAEQYMRDVEGGDHTLWNRPAWIKHNWWINLLWAVTMTLMAAATAVSGATAHPDRTWSMAGIIANYDVQLGIFGAAVLINLVYTLCLRRYYKPSKEGDSPPSLNSTPMAPDVAVGLDRDLELAQPATQNGHKVQQVSRKEGREEFSSSQSDSKSKVSSSQSEFPHIQERDSESPPMTVESYGPTKS